jgi:hypothetical protein
MSANRISLIIAALAVVAVAAVLVVGGGVDLPSLGGGDDADDRPAAAAEPQEEAASDDEPAEPEVPDDPDAVRGTDPYALTRPGNLRRALAVLDERRARVGGAFEGLRVAPGRIDTTIVHPDDRRTNIQVRADLEVAFESTHDFPTQPDFRKRGLTARDVNARAPQRLLRAIDGRRRGSAERDVDYLVLAKDIIEFDVEVSAYMRLRTAHPRMFLWEDGEARPIG